MNARRIALDLPTCRRGASIAVVALVTGIASTSGVAAADAGRGLCAVDETVYLACRIGTTRWASVCGRSTTEAQYRFGRPGAIELRFPSDASAGPKRLRFAHYSRFQRDRIEITFENDGVGYTIYDDRDAARSATGITVVDAKGIVHELACRPPVVHRLERLETVVACDADNAINGGSCP